MAHRVISRARNNQVAFGEKRTSTGRHDRLARSQMTLREHQTLETLPPTHALSKALISHAADAISVLVGEN
jgi:hypothetical protein